MAEGWQRCGRGVAEGWQRGGRGVEEEGWQRGGGRGVEWIAEVVERGSEGLVCVGWLGVGVAPGSVDDGTFKLCHCMPHIQVLRVSGQYGIQQTTLTRDPSR